MLKWQKMHFEERGVGKGGERDSYKKYIKRNGLGLEEKNVQRERDCKQRKGPLSYTQHTRSFSLTHALSLSLSFSYHFF